MNRVHSPSDAGSLYSAAACCADGTVDWHQGVEFYNFARRAGKTDFVLLVYPGEDHGLRRKENRIDYQQRILQVVRSLAEG